jgi:2-methylisocitrate lyase-like PEP mutase family enzyme
MTQEEKARMFAALHVDTFVLPNAWDVASARIFEEEKFQAVATTSAGIAYAMGHADGQRISPDDMIGVVRRIAKAVALPVSADVEGGYGDPLTTAQRAWEAGAVGINLEDMAGDEASAQVPIERQAELIRRIREAVPALVVNARTDTFLASIGEEESRFSRALERLQVYGEAGAQCVFAPGLKNAGVIKQLTAALKTPLNILAGPGFPSVKEMKDLGVKRISLGSGPMRACLGLIARIAQELQNSGTYQAITEGQYPYSEANRLLERKL